MLRLQEFSVKKKPKVVVIGAGIAGLTTAYRLHKGGMDVDIYEARNRVGGRIFTINIQNTIAELGGQNICDGGEATHLKRLIEEFGLSLIYKRLPFEYSYFNGTGFIPMRELLREKKFKAEPLKHQIDELIHTSRNMQEVLEKIIDKSDPLYKIAAVRLAAYEGGSIEELSPLYGPTLFHTLLGGMCSAHQGNGEIENYINFVTIEGGNASLPEKIGESLGEKLHLGIPLTRVVKSKEGGYRLTFKQGKEVQADLLVLAIPCSVYDQIIFENETIIQSQLNAIRNVKYGKNAKILVPLTTSTPKQTRVLVDNATVNFFDHTQQIFTIYCTGESSYFSPNTLASRYNQIRPMIERSFEKDCPPFQPPTYAKDLAHIAYDAPVGYSWPNDLYAKGTYSYIAAGQENLLTMTLEETGEIFKALFAPIQQRLYFVGEHTSILSETPGTMEAACESGERIARAILKTHLTQKISALG